MRSLTVRLRSPVAGRSATTRTPPVSDQLLQFPKPTTPAKRSCQHWGLLSSATSAVKSKPPNDTEAALDNPSCPVQLGASELACRERNVTKVCFFVNQATKKPRRAATRSQEHKSMSTALTITPRTATVLSFVLCEDTQPRSGHILSHAPQVTNN